MKLWDKVVRFGFRLLYHEMAFTYDRVSQFVSLGDWRTWQRAVFDFLPPPSETGILLELAHGTGNLQIDFANRGYNTIALDFSAQMGRIAQKKLHRQGIAPHLIRASGMALPFTDNQFGYAVCTFPTEFIFNPKTLTELHRVMKQGGEVIIVLAGELMRRNVQTRLVDVAYAVANHRAPSDMEKRVNERILPHKFHPTWHQVTHEKSRSSVITLKRG
ncbi:MAG: class I SAM-dependent methyltransferase [Anaerolineae bacterium]|jgi:ubiquinone/menaquinone biosynthesis C-methylase UbiE|nr:class I SAM-dependent methyltransferase [Anaerolineae bacterium]